MAVTGMIAVFIVGYVFIALEHKIKINKSATALLMSGVLWTIFILSAHRFGLTDCWILRMFGKNAMNGNCAG